MTSRPAWGPLLLILPLLAPAGASTAAQDDCGTGADAPYVAAQGAVLAAPVACEAFFDGSDDERDAYRFEAPPGTRFTVTVTPLTSGQAAAIQLYTPDHGDGMGSRFEDRAWGSVGASSDEPGLWAFFLDLRVAQGSGVLARGAYRLEIALEGAPVAPDAFAGRVALGAPGGSVANRILGPSAHDGLDGDWIELGPAGRRDFLRLSWDAGAGRLGARFADADGAPLSAWCGREAGRLDCVVPADARRVLVEGLAGRDVSFDALRWRIA